MCQHGATPWLRLLVYVSLATVGANVVPGCDLGLLLTLQRQVEPVVSEIAEIHYNFTSAKHFEVIEVISMFQVDRICRSVLKVVESIRQTVGSLVCPPHFDDGIPLDELPERLEPSKFLQQYFADVRQLARTGDNEIYTEEMINEVSSSWAPSEKELLTLVLRIENWAVESRTAGYLMQAETFRSIELLVRRFLAMAVDFVRSLAEDMSAMFRAPNYVSREMTPGGQSDSDEHKREERPVTVDIFKHRGNDLVLKAEFLSMLRDMPSPMYQSSLHVDFKVCESLLTSTGPVWRGVPLEFLDEAGGWSHRDVTGAHRREASPLQLLQAIAATGTRLSNLFISVQVSPHLLTPSPSCGTKHTIYDPSHCLVDRQWAGYFFHLNPLPPFNVSVVYSGRPLGPHGKLSSFEVHHVHVPSMDTQWSSLVSLFKSMNHHSPDTLFISPFVGNCQIIDRLMRTGTIKPKVVYVPVNPLIAPGHMVKPDYFEWWEEHGFVFMRQLTEGVTALGDMEGSLPVTTSMWFAQCSISATVDTMSGYGYELLHLEHTYAAFLWRPFHQELFEKGTSQGSSRSLEDVWLRGWHCSPHARFIFDLEIWGKHAFDKELLFKPVGMSEQTQMREYAVMAMVETPGLRYFLQQGPKPRGSCGEGICECLPPYRGHLCELEEKPRKPQKLKAVIHYMMAESEHDLLDMERSLKSLWIHYNQGVDHPVVVFHEGLTPKARRRLVEASENRLWFALVPRFKEIPDEWKEASRQRASEFSVGYRAMTRWRSGPLFLEQALAGFDYAMTLDTDSYFPASFGSDPFEVLHSTGLTAMFPHLGRESASVVVNFMHYFLLYCRLHRLNPRRTRMLAALIEKNFKWYQQCLMLDIEVVRLDWFRSEAYQDFFRYMDSVGGFWLHRWGNNPLRTFAVALLLGDEDVRSVVMPYAHQDFCSCGPGAPSCTWDSKKQEYICENVTPKEFTLEELSEGLLDLQPWRGSARQLSRQAEMDVYRFAGVQS